MRFLLLTLASLHLFGIPLSHRAVLSVVEFANPEESIPFTGFYRMKKQSALFFKDLGAQYIKENSGFRGFYLSFESVRENSGKAFGKWRDTLKQPQYTKLLELFEANIASSNLSELFSFPSEVHFLKNAKNKTILLFLDYKLPLTMQVREILNFSLRGYNVLAVDFYHHSEGKYFLPWEECKRIADAAYNSLSGEILLYGKSYGSAPATYLAVKHKCSSLILDRPFSSMNEVASSYLLSDFINEHYSYPVEELISKITKAPLIIAAEDNKVFNGQARKLIHTFIDSHKEVDSKLILKKCFISTRGGHYSSLLNKGESSWFSYEGAQSKLNEYLLDSDNKLLIP